MQGSMEVLEVGVCDSSEIALAGLRSALAAYHINVYATAATCDAGLALAGMARGRVVLVDIELGGTTCGVPEVMQAIRSAGGTPIGIGVNGDPESVFRALRWGAAGYLTKDLPVRAWAGAIRAAERGEAPLSRAMTTRLVTEFYDQTRLNPAAELLPSDRRLTRREWQVLELIADGKTNRAMAADLQISVETVRTHVSNILCKLESPNRSAAAARYQQLRVARG
jgi:DNA-binding NarL/FixJ family response regulator